MSLILEIVRLVLGWFTAVAGGVLELLSGWLVVVFGGLVGFLWGWVLFLSLFAAAVVLNVMGVEDVSGVIFRRIDRDGDSDTDAMEAVRKLSSERITDEAGRFSPTAFERATGMAPAEFVYLFVRGNGGRIKQKTLNTCLPWSKSTVTRLLNSLEDDGVIVRITVGRENIVCTPDSAPEADP